MVLCCYDFRLKLLECLNETIEYFRFEFNLLQLELLIENIVHFKFEISIFELLIENMVHFRFLTSGLATRACLSTLWNIHLKILCIFG